MDCLHRVGHICTAIYQKVRQYFSEVFHRLQFVQERLEINEEMRERREKEKYILSPGPV